MLLSLDTMQEYPIRQSFTMTSDNLDQDKVVDET